MPLSVNFRWKTPFVQAPQTDWEKNNMTEQMKILSDSIIAAKKRRYDKEQQERRNKIEDENNRRAWDAEDRKVQAAKETATYIQGMRRQLEQLQQQRAQVVQQIDQLKAQIGG